MTQQPIRICILGGGFGGLYTALRLSQMPWTSQNQPEIVLVDKSDRFLFLPLLYELISDELQTWEIAPQFQDLLAGTGIQFHQGKVLEINSEEKIVHLQEGATLAYDYLVLSFGGETPTEIVPGAPELTYQFRSIADAYRLKERLQNLKNSDSEKIRVAIVGAGYTGVELACKIADVLGEAGRVRLIDMSDRILAQATEYNRETAQKALEDHGIWVDLETTVSDLQPDSLALTYKGVTDTIPADMIVWTVGMKVAEVIQALPFKKNPRGQIYVTPTLQVIDHPEIFALGDAADCKDAEGQQVPTTAQVALQQADYAGWNIWAAIANKPLLPFRYTHLGEMMTLGTHAATITAMGFKLDGAPASVIRKLLYLYRLPTLEHQLRVGLNWAVKPFYSLLSALERL